jgi:Glycosyltransferase 61
MHAVSSSGSPQNNDGTQQPLPQAAENQSQPFIPKSDQETKAQGQEPIGDFSDGGKTNFFKKPSCDFSDMQFDLCDVEGDVRVHGQSSTVFSVASTENYISESNNETWSVRPHPRKYATELMSQFRQVKVEVEPKMQAPKCNVTHNSAAVIFATGGYNGNYFHDFTDLLVPLFITSYQFKGEVQFLVSNIQHWFIFKYMGLLRKLSNYEIIDFDKEERIHCYRRVIVGISKHKDLTIESSRAPNNISTVEFGRFAKEAYSLKRNLAVRLGEETAKKPRLLIMARNHSRALMNREEIVPLIEALGFEVVIGDATFSMDIGKFAHLVNSADVMMGVHGAGLTNFVFLPTNAVLIQIVPLGKYERTCEYDFGEPAVDMGLRYLQYSISEEESTLSDLYPRDHAVFRDPESIHRRGWQVANGLYLGKQNVWLNFPRFRPILERALDLLRH